MLLQLTGLKRSCREIFVELHGYVEIPNSKDIDSTENNIASIDECERLCNSDYRCVSIGYYADLKECSLYDRIPYNDPSQRRHRDHIYRDFYVLQCGNMNYILYIS